jgi:hypothetical protein
MSLDTEQLAYLVLEVANRTQGKGTTMRLVLPRAPEVANELDPTLAEHELLAAEEAALESALRAEVEEERRRLEEFERELDEARRELLVAQDSPGATQAVREEPEKENPWSSTGGAQEDVERPWWRRLLEG